jgi:uncharacterized membrane protein
MVFRTRGQGHQVSSVSGHRGPSLPLGVAAALYRFRESLFLLPTVVVLSGIALEETAARLDRKLGAGAAVPFTLSMSSNSATWLLSTVAGAMITTAGVVFSLTVVSLQLASSQFSPRVMRSFIRDRLSQVVIGLLVATFVYSVLTLRHVSGEATDPAPRVSMTVAVVLAVATVVLIIAHLDHLARGLQVGEVARWIAREGEQVVDAMLQTGESEKPAASKRAMDGDAGFVVPAVRDGWVTQVATEQVLRAVPEGATVRLETRNGAYIHQGEPLVTVVPTPAPSDQTAVARRMSAAVVIGDSRTMQEDVDFALRQLVDIGLRALSPAINDPTTAVEVTLRLGSLLRKLLVVDLPPEAVAGSNGRVLLRPWNLRHEEYIEHVFDPLRQAAPGQPSVAAALLRVLRMLLAHVQDAGRPEAVAALERQIRLLLEEVDVTPGLHPADRTRLLAVSHDSTDPGDHSPDLALPAGLDSGKEESQ